MPQILVVDDSEAVQQEMSSALTKNGFTVETAGSGEEGLNKAQKHPEIQLIISDVNMPGMDGITMVDNIRNKLGNSKVMVWILTTENDSQLKMRAKTLNVAGWIVKPFNIDGAIGVLRKLIK